jgi:CHAD domain-containing protein
LRAAFAAKNEVFARHVDEVGQTLTSARRSRQSLRKLAVPMLTGLLHEFESAARDDLTHYEALHHVRILGKQLRYAMEVFESCFKPEFRERYYPTIVEMQDILGLANDSFTACQRLTALRNRLKLVEPKRWPHFKDGIEKLLHFHERRLPTQRKKFEKWWQNWLQSGTEKALVDMIGAD